MSAPLHVEGLVKRYGSEDAAAVDGVSFQVDAGRLLTLLGPSGCGKTTTLRCIAGLVRPGAGEIQVGDTVLFSAARGIEVPANRRGLGMVFQSYGLWPHMTVFDTVAFPLTLAPRRSRPGRREVRARVEEALAIVQLDGLEARRSPELSGGQQQRLALARALVMQPRVLLMDEPLSNLDARLRDDMRLELKRLQRELDLTAVYVTHDQTEAFALSYDVAVMRAGKIEQVGRPREVYERPQSTFVADFVGNTNLIEGVVAAREGDVYSISTSAGPLLVRSDARLTNGGRVVVSIRGEAVRLELDERADGRPNRWTGTVSARAFRGDAIDHIVAVGDERIRVRCAATLSVPPGTRVSVELPVKACALIPA